MGSQKKTYDVYELISKNIRKYRIEANMTQEELAMKANYSHQFIRKIEAPNVSKTFSLNAVYCISKALNKEFSLMFDESVLTEDLETLEDTLENGEVIK